jgi:lipoate-protein ligase A
VARAWRLLVDGPAPGPWNMGVDEALLASASAGAPALRFYGWRGPWLSLGYAQRLAPERRAACQAAGVGVVRRSTGGGAVLHGSDLTYAVVAPEALLPGGLKASYRVIAGGLVMGLRQLGIAAERSPSARSRGTERVFDCFAEPAGDEICAGGRKLVGSAQRRAGGLVLQHGSLRLAPDAPGVREAAGLGATDATSLAELGRAPEPRALREALQDALGRALEARFEPARLTPEEHTAAAARSLEPPKPR